MPWAGRPGGGGGVKREKGCRWRGRRAAAVEVLYAVWPPLPAVPRRSKRGVSDWDGSVQFDVSKKGTQRRKPALSKGVPLAVTVTLSGVCLLGCKFSAPTVHVPYLLAIAEGARQSGSTFFYCMRRAGSFAALASRGVVVHSTFARALDLVAGAVVPAARAPHEHKASSPFRQRWCRRSRRHVDSPPHPAGCPPVVPAGGAPRRDPPAVAVTDDGPAAVPRTGLPSRPRGSTRSPTLVDSTAHLRNARSCLPFFSCGPRSLRGPPPRPPPPPHRQGRLPKVLVDGAAGRRPAWRPPRVPAYMALPAAVGDRSA